MEFDAILGVIRPVMVSLVRQFVLTLVGIVVTLVLLRVGGSALGLHFLHGGLVALAALGFC